MLQPPLQTYKIQSNILDFSLSQPVLDFLYAACVSNVFRGRTPQMPVPVIPDDMTVERSISIQFCELKLTFSTSDVGGVTPLFLMNANRFEFQQTSLKNGELRVRIQTKTFEVRHLRCPTEGFELLLSRRKVYIYIFLENYFDFLCFFS
jgi:hypothetical protein